MEGGGESGSSGGGGWRMVIGGVGIVRVGAEMVVTAAVVWVDSGWDWDWGGRGGDPGDGQGEEEDEEAMCWPSCPTRLSRAWFLCSVST